MLWGLGLCLYGIFVTLFCYRIFFLRLAPDDVGPLLWVVMGAAAISANAGTALIARCLHAARRLGYRQCYLETLTGMDAAQALYERAGFQRITQAMGATGHFGCNRFYLRAL